MATQLPVIKNDAGGATLYTALVSQAAPSTFQVNPTLAAGDVKISIDGGAFANLGTLPTVTPAAGRGVKIVLSQAETNGDNLLIVFSDAAGGEWCDQEILIQTAARHLDDHAFPATSGRSIAVDASGNVPATIAVTAVSASPRGVVGAASSTTSVVTSTMAPAGAIADQFKSRTILFDPATATTTLRGVARQITASSNAALPVLTVDALPAAPASGDTFQIV